jgi:RHS repeat-associated protein
MYLPDEQLTDADGTITGVRYYSLPGGVTAVRTGSGDDYGFEMASDQHGTNTLYLDSTAQDPTWRQYDPFGNTRGTAPATGTFPDDDRGFLNDPGDAVTGLTNIGSRWYDPSTGTFASLDPVLETSSPTELNGYCYAGNDPVNSSDPTGDMPAYQMPDGGTYVGYAPSAEKVFQEQLDYNTIPPYEPSYTPDYTYDEFAAPPAPKKVIHTVTAPSCAMGAAVADGGCAPAAAGGVDPAIAGGAAGGYCEGRMIQLGACAGEAGLAGDTPAQVKQSMEGAGIILGGALLDPLADIGLAGLLSDSAEDEGPGAWADVNESMSNRAAAYQEQITGRSGSSYVVDGVKFDGYSDGQLIDAKGPGYARFVNSDGDFKPWFQGAQGFVDQGQSQLAAADGTPIAWYFAEEQAAAATENLFAQNDIAINVVYQPPAG